MGIDGLNVFGSLTTKAGQNLKMEDLDLNKDGKVEEAEYKRVMEDYKLDSVEFSTIDSSGDKNITEDEFVVYEQKVAIQEELNKLADTIKADCKDYPSCTTVVEAALKEYAANFCEKEGANIQGDKLAEEFAKQLPAKYEQVLADAIENSPEKTAERNKEIASKAIDNAVARVIDETQNFTYENASNAIKTVGAKLEALAEKYVASYTGTNLEEDLTKYLEEQLQTNDSEKMEDAYNKYLDKTQSFGAYIDKNELVKQKEAAKELLMEGLNQGLQMRMNGKNLATEKAIDDVLKGYNDPYALHNDIVRVISELSKTSMLEDALGTKATIKGEDLKVAVDINKIDLSTIPGYETAETVSNEKRNWFGKKAANQVKEQTEAQARETLEGLRENFKAQILTILKEKGLTENDIAGIFDNAFNTAVTESINECMTVKQGGWFTKQKASYNVKELVDTFTAKFNEKIGAAWNTNNASQTDFDTADIDYKQIITDEKLIEAFEDGKTIAYEGKKETGLSAKKSEGVALEQANQIAETLKPIMLEKAKAMCKANGVAFNQTAFDNLWNASVRDAINAGVQEWNYYEKMNAEQEDAFEEFAGMNITAFFGRVHENVSAINPSIVYNTLVEDFKNDYTNWIKGNN